MEMTIKTTETEYPYLALLTFGDNLPQKINPKDVYVLSIKGENNDVFATKLDGSEHYETKQLKNWSPLPKGTVITIIQ